MRALEEPRARGTHGNMEMEGQGWLEGAKGSQAKGPAGVTWPGDLVTK